MPEPIVLILVTLVVVVTLSLFAYYDREEFELEEYEDDWGMDDEREKGVFELREVNTGKTKRLNR